jgi:hypothetical protein
MRLFAWFGLAVRPVLRLSGCVFALNTGLRGASDSASGLEALSSFCVTATNETLHYGPLPTLIGLVRFFLMESWTPEIALLLELASFAFLTATIPKGIGRRYGRAIRVPRRDLLFALSPSHTPFVRLGRDLACGRCPRPQQVRPPGIHYPAVGSSVRHGPWLVDSCRNVRGLKKLRRARTVGKVAPPTSRRTSYMQEARLKVCLTLVDYKSCGYEN